MFEVPKIEVYRKSSHGSQTSRMAGGENLV